MFQTLIVHWYAIFSWSMTIVLFFFYLALRLQTREARRYIKQIAELKNNCSCNHVAKSKGLNHVQETIDLESPRIIFNGQPAKQQGTPPVRTVRDLYSRESPSSGFDAGSIRHNVIRKPNEHDHGPVKCKNCPSVLQKCVCLPKGTMVEWVICPTCKAEQAYQIQQKTAEANQKLRDLGISRQGKNKK